MTIFLSDKNVGFGKKILKNFWVGKNVESEKISISKKVVGNFFF